MLTHALNDGPTPRSLGRIKPTIIWISHVSNPATEARSWMLVCRVPQAFPLRALFPSTVYPATCFEVLTKHCSSLAKSVHATEAACVSVAAHRIVPTMPTMPLTIEVSLLSGRSASLEARLDESVRALRIRAQKALGVGRCKLLDCSGRVLDSAATLEHCRLRNGDSVTLQTGNLQILSR